MIRPRLPRMRPEISDIFSDPARPFPLPGFLWHRAVGASSTPAGEPQMPRFQRDSGPTATCAARDRRETSRSTAKLGGASASNTQLIGPTSFSHVQGTSCAIIDSHAATDQTIMIGVTISAPLRRHVSTSNTVISGTATVTYCGPADGIINGSAADKMAPATRTG